MKKKSLIRSLAVIMALSLLAVPAYAGQNMAEASAPAEYLAQYPVDTLTARAASQPLAGESTDTVLRGKSILFVGDSLTAGYGLSNADQSWPMLLQSSYGMEVTLCSVSASTFVTSDLKEYTTGGCYEPYVERTLPEGNFDLVLVEGGGNDWYCAAPLGDSLDSRDPKTFKGAVNVVIDRIGEKYPDAALVFMTPWVPKERESTGWTPEMDYYEALSQVCQAREVPCFQARDPEVSGIYAGDSAFRGKYFLTEEDPWHLNAAGQALFAPVIARWLEDQVRQRVLVAGFLDVKRQQWFADTVQYAVDRGLMNGMEPDRFGPDELMRRGMLVTVLYRAAGEPSVAGMEQPFEDVAEGKYYRNAVCWCYQQGMVTGIDERRFDAEGYITREQMAAILYRQRVSAEVPPAESLPENLKKFTDGAKTSGYAVTPLAWTVEQGIIKGMGDGTVDPQGQAKRAQVATMLQRYLQSAEKGPEAE